MEFFTTNKKTLGISCVFLKRSLKCHKFCYSYDWKSEILLITRMITDRTQWTPLSPITIINLWLLEINPPFYKRTVTVLLSKRSLLKSCTSVTDTVQYSWNPIQSGRCLLWGSWKEKKHQRQYCYLSISSISGRRSLHWGPWQEKKHRCRQ